MGVETRTTGGAFGCGRPLGIPIRLHFTFLLLLLWFGIGRGQHG